jgi:ABC-type lipoprotein release transport system permease subunit
MNLTTVRIAWRNIWRHPQRTALMIAIVAFGSALILLMWGLTDGFIESMVSTQIDFDSGDFQVRAAGYGDDPLPQKGLTRADVTKIESTLADFPSSWTSTVRLETTGMLRSAYGTLGVGVRGIDPMHEPAVTEAHKTLREGRFVTGPGEIVVSRKAAEDLDVRLGERVVLLAFTEDASTSQSFTTVGIVETGLTTLDLVVFVTLEGAQGLTSWEGATAVVVSIPKGTNRERAANRLEEALVGRADVEVSTYFELNPLIRVMLSGSVVKLTPFVIMVALLAGFGVANTVFYSVLERTREFGVMTAVGMSTKQLALVVLFESIYVSAIGFVAGGAIGYWGLLYLSRVGLNFGGLMGDMGAEFGIPTVLYASTSGIYWLASFSVVVFTGLIAAWYPARRASRLQPVAAIREG